MIVVLLCVVDRIGTGGVAIAASILRLCVVRLRIVVHAGDDGLGLRRIRIGERQLRVEFAEILQRRQRRQLVEALQAEVIEEALGGAQQFRTARHVAMADDPDPFALFQRLDDVAADRHAADLFDLAAGDRLAVGDDRQRFQRRAGVFGLAFGPQPRDPGVDIGLHLEAIAGGGFRQFDAAAFAGGAQIGQRLFDAAFRRGFVDGEQPAHLHDGQRLVGRKQGGFDDAGDEVLIHGVGFWGGLMSGRCRHRSR